MKHTHRLLAIALVSWTAACQASPRLVADQPFQVGEPLKLGAIVPENGLYSKVSLPIVDALLLLRDTVNACGGVNRAPVSLAFYNHEADRQRESLGMRYLVNDVGVHGIVAVLNEPIDTDTVATAIDRNVSVLSPTATDTIESKRRSALQGWSQLSLTQAQQGQALAKLAIAKDWQRATLLVSDTEGGLSFEQTFIQTFEALGGEVTNREGATRYPHSRTASDADRDTPLLAPTAALEQPDDRQTASDFIDPDDPDALTRNTDVLVASLQGRRSYRFLKSIIEASPEGVPILLAHSVDLPALGESRWQRLDPDDPYVLSGVTGLLPAVDDESLQRLRARWQGAEGRQWGEYVPQAWDAAALLVLAAEAAGRNGRAPIQAKLKDVANPPGVRVTEVCQGLAQLRRGVMINYQGASGSVDLGVDGQLAVNSRYRVWQILDSGSIRWGAPLTLR